VGHILYRVETGTAEKWWGTREGVISNFYEMEDWCGMQLGIHGKSVPSFGRRILLMEAIMNIFHNSWGLALKLD